MLLYDDNSKKSDTSLAGTGFFWCMIRSSFDITTLNRMNSLRRMLNVLDLFKPDQPVLDVDIICSQLGYSPASAYRYLRELGEVGLLVRLARGYALGPKVIALDRQMTDYDPILVCGRDLIDNLVAETGLDALISELYGTAVINVLLKRGTESAYAGAGRGRPIDLFRTATSRVVLAYLLPRQIRRIYDARASDPEILKMGLTWKDFSKGLLAIRKQGYCISEGELNPERSGIAAPVFDEKRRVLGSITIVGSSDRFKAFRENYLANLVTGAATELTARISAQ